MNYPSDCVRYMEEVYEQIDEKSMKKSMKKSIKKRIKKSIKSKSSKKAHRNDQDCKICSYMNQANYDSQFTMFKQYKFCIKSFD